ncbi:MAG: hypothetical protein ACYTEZ_09700 [Planctomycetota bacterium]|jgi:DNA-directed RNA polymerase subunit RPC12/RpoP
MRRQKCSKCGTMLDVTRLEKGSKFACSNCGAILVSGEATVVKRSLKGAGPAFEPKSKQEVAMPERSRHRRPPQAAAAPASRSRLPLFLGIGAVAAVVIVVVLFTGGGGGDEGGVPRIGGGGGTSQGPTRDDWWAPRSSRLPTADAKTLRAWLAEAKELGYDTDPVFWGPTADEIYRALLRRDPDDAEANRRAGRRSLRDYPAFRSVWEQMNENFRALPREQKDFLDRYSTRIDEGTRVWLDGEAWSEAKASLDAFVAWRKKQAENPAAPKIQKGIGEASAILGKEFAFEAVVEAPFILLLVYRKAEEDAQAAKQALQEKGRKYAQALRVLREEFDRRIRRPLSLPALQEGRYFYQVLLNNRDDFARFVRAGEGYDVSGDVAGFFSPRTKWAGVYVGPEAQEARQAAGDLAHEATHQLHWYFSRDPKMKLLYYFDEWNGIWLTEGWAEYLGGGLEFDPATGKTTFTGRPARRLEFLKGMRDNGVPHIQVRDLVQLSSVQSFSRYIFGTWLPLIRNDEDMPEGASQWLGAHDGMVWKLLYAQTWFLTYFLNEYEDGRYRPQYLDLVLTALRGKLKPEKYRKDKTIAERWGSAYAAFVNIMGLKDEKAWKQLQREHDRFLKKTLRDG